MTEINLCGGPIPGKYFSHVCRLEGVTSMSYECQAKPFSTILKIYLKVFGKREDASKMALKYSQKVNMNGKEKKRSFYIAKFLSQQKVDDAHNIVTFWPLSTFFSRTKPKRSVAMISIEYQISLCLLWPMMDYFSQGQLH